jgi:hypothetical protein
MKPTRSKAKVENHPSLMRDLKTTAIVNNDDAAYTRYMSDKRARLSTKEELNTLRAEIDYLKSLILQRNK